MSSSAPGRRKRRREVDSSEDTNAVETETIDEDDVNTSLDSIDSSSRGRRLSRAAASATAPSLYALSTYEVFDRSPQELAASTSLRVSDPLHHQLVMKRVHHGRPELHVSDGVSLRKRTIVKRSLAGIHVPHSLQVISSSEHMISQKQ